MFPAAGLYWVEVSVRRLGDRSPAAVPEAWRVPMNPDPTIPISLDYLVELSDDGQRSNQAEPEVILIPPTPDIDRPSSPPATKSLDQKP
jgi:hypothetical protein